LAVVLIAAVVAAVVVMAKLGVLPTWALVLAVAVDGIVALGVASMLLLSGPNRHRGRFVVATVLSVLMIIGNLGVVKVGTDFLRFLGTDIQAPSTNTVVYDVVVLKDGPADVAALAGSEMGLVSDDPLVQPVRDKVAGMVQVEFVDSTPWSSTVAALTGGQVTSMVIQDGYMQVFSDADPDQYANLKILTSFEIDRSLAATPSPSPSATATATPSPVPVGSAFIVYVSGNDEPGSLSASGRSDVNILMVVNPDTGKVLLINTPRDYFVQLHGTTGLKDKLTHAGIYGVDMSVGTLEDLYGITINYYIRINFSSLIKIVDALGGVDVHSAYTFSAMGFNFVEGVNHLNGEQALAFSRERHSFEGGDRVRGENQERVIAAIIKRMSDPAVLVNYPSILAATQGFVQTSMPQDTITALIKNQLTTGRSWEVTSTSVTGSDALEYTYSMPGQRLYVMPPDQSSLDAAKAQISSILQG
jgi:LCP family protein required for cell wall assembly